MVSVPIVAEADVAKAEQRVLKTTYDQFRNVQFYAKDTPWISRAMFAKAEKTELESNWYKNIRGKWT